MPNKVQILAYIECMKHRLNSAITHGEMYHSPGTGANKVHLEDVKNLEKFIRGEK